MQKNQCYLSLHQRKFWNQKTYQKNNKIREQKNEVQIIRKHKIAYSRRNTIYYKSIRDHGG